MKVKKILGMVTCLLLVLSLAAVATGAGYPSKEITYMIAFNAGGESDIEFRIMQPYLEAAFGVRFVANINRQPAAPWHGIFCPPQRLTDTRLAGSTRPTSSPSR